MFYIENLNLESIEFRIWEIYTTFHSYSYKYFNSIYRNLNIDFNLFRILSGWVEVGSVRLVFVGSVAVCVLSILTIGDSGCVWWFSAFFVVWFGCDGSSMAAGALGKMWSIFFEVWLVLALLLLFVILLLMDNWEHANSYSVFLGLDVVSFGFDVATFGFAGAAFFFGAFGTWRVRTNPTWPSLTIFSSHCCNAWLPKLEIYKLIILKCEFGSRT